MMTAFSSPAALPKQLERSELLQLVTDCEQLSRSMSEHASAHRALSHEAASLASMKRSAEELHSEGNKPIIAISAPEGILQASGAGIASYAATNSDQIAQQNLQCVAGHRYLVNAGKGISLFSHSNGIHQIAQKGRVLIQSQSDATDINSCKDMTLTSSEGKIVGMAKEIVLVAEDGSFIKIGNGITIGTSGTINYHASKHPFQGAKTMKAALPNFESGSTNLRVVTAYEKGTARETVAPNKDVKIEHDNGTVVEARTDAAGKTKTMTSDEMHQVVVTPLEREDS
jgi:type VI secretion system secreted protein VgrG